MADIRMIGADKLVKSIASRVDRDKVNGVIKRNAAQTQRKMMKNASFGPYKTGTTKRSISIELQPMFLSAEVGPGTDYSPYLEYGTRFMDAQPFVRPTRNEQAPIFLKDLQNLIRRG